MPNHARIFYQGKARGLDPLATSLILFYFSPIFINCFNFNIDLFSLFYFLKNELALFSK
jgi:hypothetical protein